MAVLLAPAQIRSRIRDHRAWRVRHAPAVDMRLRPVRSIAASFAGVPRLSCPPADIQDKAFERDLWDGKSGMSRPPWLLALSGDVMELGEEWNCDGLGRGSMSMVQSSLLRKSGFDHKALRSLGVKMNAMGIITPYIATCSATAKLLHFDGRLKPWRADGSRRHELPLCRAPPMLERDWHWKRAVRVFCDDVAFVGCHEIWSTFVSARVVEGLIDVNAVWREDEFRWADRSAEDLREQEASRVARAWDDMYNAEEARSHEAEGGG